MRGHTERGESSRHPRRAVHARVRPPHALPAPRRSCGDVLAFSFTEESQKRRPSICARACALCCRAGPEITCKSRRAAPFLALGPTVSVRVGRAPKSQFRYSTVQYSTRYCTGTVQCSVCPCAPACPVRVPCVSRLPPVSFYRYSIQTRRVLLGARRNEFDTDRS